MSKEQSNIKTYIVYGLILLLLVIVFKVFIFGSMGYSMVVIDNDDPNSLYPTYFQGDMFIIQKIPAQNIKIGNIVVYEDSRGQSIIHRVIDIVHLRVGNSEFYYYRVKGDNPITNSVPDYRGTTVTAITLIAYDQIQGVVKYRIPSLGLYNLAKDTPRTGVLYLLGIGILFVGLFFWPEENEDKKQSKQIKEKRISWKWKQASLKKILKNYPYATIIVLILLFSFLGLYVYAYSPHESNEIVSLTISNGPIEFHDRLGTYERNVTFIQISGTFYFAPSLTTKVTLIQVEIYDAPTHSLVNMTQWQSLRLLRGEATIGLSGVYDTSNLTITNNQYSLIIKVSMVNTAFFHHDIIDQDSLTVTFQI